MTLLVLMYHRAMQGPYGNSAAMLDAHFACISRNHACVLPGDPLDARRLNICLSFDDGYFDFYSVVMPLLEKHGLRAMLGVVPAFVHERSNTIPSEHPKSGTPSSTGRSLFCTWSELEEISASGRVTIAAHGFTHLRLDQAEIDFHTEIVLPQSLLSARLNQSVNSFVLPYGRFSKVALQQIRQHYRYVFRIGGAINKSWDENLLYRVDADQMRSANELFNLRQMTAYRMRRHWNRLRGR